MSTTTKQKEALDTKVDGLTWRVPPLNRFFLNSLLLTLFETYRNMNFVTNEVLVWFDRGGIWKTNAI